VKGRRKMCKVLHRRVVMMLDKNGYGGSFQRKRILEKSFFSMLHSFVNAKNLLVKLDMLIFV